MGNYRVSVRALLLATISLTTAQNLCYAAATNSTSSTAKPDKFFTLPIANPNAGQHLEYRYGVPFMVTPSSTAQIKVDAAVKKIFILGLTETMRPSAWSDPLDMSRRFFIGDNLGVIRLTYADGSTQNFPLIVGESAWFGMPFYQTREPFPTDAHLRSAFAQSSHLYPAAPVDDGNYVAVIDPRTAPLASIEIIPASDKKGSVSIAGVTAETAQDQSVPGLRYTPFDSLDPKFAEFVQHKSLRPEGVDESISKARLGELRAALYTSAAQWDKPVAVKPVPSGYTGPRVTIKGNNYSNILQNAFYANVQDMLAKVDAKGFYHTSTPGALAWSGAPWSASGEFGTWRNGVGVYADQSWSRDLGRTMQELADLGFIDPATRGLDLALRDARLYQENPNLTFRGGPLPPHWSRIINRPDPAWPFENDGHGLISIALYRLWLHLPDRDAWLRAHWTDVKAAGDWIPWQFAHPDLSGVKNGILHTTGESAGGNGYSVYPDYICMTALESLARMADSIGQTDSASLWRDRAAKMRSAMYSQYIVSDPKYGDVWTLKYAGWPNKSTVLGPLITQADTNAYEPEQDPKWQAADQAAYQRLIDTYKPLGFYGWAMGYGQGFVSQAALLLDRMNDATAMFDWTAREVYDPAVGSAAEFIVPEGAQLDPTGKFIYRTGDQGNGVQEDEIVKAFRLVIGIDDLNPQHLQILPRIPYDWTEFAVDKYPVLYSHDGKTETAMLRYRLVRTGSRMAFEISASKPIGTVPVRLGPFKDSPSLSSVLVNGKHPEGASVIHSGDSWWVSCSTDLGPNR
ncbi:MAG TPA: hypothetical protein VGU25_01340 [Acidobacteriaceae bacterium]|nr:hypothetical protein [Acidobacteriaceae bacterium]